MTEKKSIDAPSCTNEKVSAIVLVAGNSTRYGQNRNKNFDKLNGKEVFLYSIEAFDSNPNIDEVVVVYKKEEEHLVKNLITTSKYRKPIKFVRGGKERQESVYNAIKTIDSDIAIVHDGARPMIKNKYIDECTDAMQVFNGATIAVKAKDTIKISDENGLVKSTPNRVNTWQIQTPQCFRRKVLLKAHEKYRNEPMITDDCMLLEKENEKIKLIEGDYTNIKITTFEDLKIAESLNEDFNN